MPEKTRNYYKTSKKWREHEINIKVLEAFAADPELKYYMGVAGGAGVAWVGAMLEKISPPDDTAGNYSNTPWMWLARQPGMPEAEMAAFQEWVGGMNDKLKSGLTGNSIGGILELGGTGFAGFCAMVLILRAMNSGSGEKGGGGGGLLGLIAGIA